MAQPRPLCLKVRACLQAGAMPIGNGSNPQDSKARSSELADMRVQLKAAQDKARDADRQVAAATAVQVSQPACMWTHSAATCTRVFQALLQSSCCQLANCQPAGKSPAGHAALLLLQCRTCCHRLLQ